MQLFSKKLRLGLIGNGAIAKQISEFCAQRPAQFEIVGALAVSADGVSVGRHALTQSLQQLLNWKPSLIVECAGHGAVLTDGPVILEAGVDLILVSVGSLGDDALRARLEASALTGKARLKVPAGALAGIDALAAARLSGLDSVLLRTAKPPLAWEDTSAASEFDLGALESPIVIFKGSARDAAKWFPKNANVAATVALAGIGFERTEVVLVASPGLACNTHMIEASGAFGRMRLEINSNPSPNNPKTSVIAALSVIRLLENETAALLI